MPVVRSHAQHGVDLPQVRPGLGRCVDQMVVRQRAEPLGEGHQGVVIQHLVPEKHDFVGQQRLVYPLDHAVRPSASTRRRR